MKIIGDRVATKAWDIERLVYSLFENPTEATFALIKTAFISGYYCGENLITRLTPQEVSMIRVLDRKLTQQSEKYREVKSLNLTDILPKQLGIEITAAAYLGINQKTQKQQIGLVVLKGASLGQLVEARMFLTLYRRHKAATWLFATGKFYWQQPIILIEREGFFEGSLLAAISPAQLQNTKKFPCKNTDIMLISRELVIDNSGYRYLEM